MQKYLAMPGSASIVTGVTKLPAKMKAGEITVTIILRRKNELHPENMGKRSLTSESYAKEYGASTDDAALVAAFVRANNLTVTGFSEAKRALAVAGKITDFEQAFKVDIKAKKIGRKVYRALGSDISVPVNLASIIEGVFGLENMPVAQSMARVAKKNRRFLLHAEATQAYTPPELAAIYGFPTGFTGQGQRIAIIEFDGGYRDDELTNYFRGLNIIPPTVNAVSIAGAGNGRVANECTMDIEIAGAISPGAVIDVYFTPNTTSGYLAALHMAMFDAVNKPNIISISWASIEDKRQAQFLNNFNEVFKSAAAMNITICAASGDQGSGGGMRDGKAHVYFPSCSPYVLGCGGTKVVSQNSRVVSETVWHESVKSATGGGISEYFPKPGYQASANVPPAYSGFAGRGVPDVAGDADPQTGYKVLVKGRRIVVGGTSATAPLFAGLIALLNERHGSPLGFIHPGLYSTPGLCRDIVSGDNITASSGQGFHAGPGWDACTGLGVMSTL